VAWRPDVADGFVVMVDERGPRIVADGLHYTNECRPDASGQWLYVVETFGRRVIRFPITADGRLSNAETGANTVVDTSDSVVTKVAVWLLT
jgi:sugar lactone lactonase YvrE